MKNPFNNELFKYYQNMINDIYYIKGEHDSKTNKTVLASKNGNNFNEKDCYWDYIDNLPDGTYYIDGE